LTLRGFTRGGDLVVDHGWVIDKAFGHLGHGYAVTSHASQGKTVDRVFVGLSSESFPAANRRQFYVSVSRGRQSAVVFTDNKEELLRAVRRADEPMSAMDLARAGQRKRPLRQRLQKHLAYLWRQAALARTHAPRPAVLEQAPTIEREAEYAR
jgi:hypothetical protein